MIENFHDWANTRHEYAKAWKQRTGGKVVGYLCTYVPEEIIYASGILPVRILGSHEPQGLTEPYISSMYCPFCRDCLAQGLEGRFDYLDGIVFARSCMHISQTFESWRLHVPISYNHYLIMPAKVQSPSAKQFLVSELAYFKESLERWTGNSISQEALDRAIEVYNTNRCLMKQIYELRKGDKPLLTGAEALGMVVSSQCMDKEEHNRLLKEFLNELPYRKIDRNTEVRLMLIGSENDDIQFTEMVESLGATVVIDDHCTGSRYFWNEVTHEEDHLSAIATRYLERPPCPAKDFDERRRLPHILQLAKDYNVEGAIIIQQKFCDPHGFDNPVIASFLEEIGIRTLSLEFDVTVPVGQFRTRVQAFLEIIQLELV